MEEAARRWKDMEDWRWRQMIGEEMEKWLEGEVRKGRPIIAMEVEHEM